jgi:hypothetical protein
MTSLICKGPFYGMDFLSPLGISNLALWGDYIPEKTGTGTGFS